MTWGVFHMASGIHTAPCTKAGGVLPGHTLTPLCECLPTPQKLPEWPRAIWRHHDNH